MVNLLNIQAKDGVVTLVAENLDNGIIENVVAHENDNYITATDIDNQRAVWGLIARYKNKGYPKETTAAWH